MKIERFFDKKLQYVLTFSLAWALITFFSKLSFNQTYDPLAFTIHTLIIATLILAGYISVTYKNKKITLSTQEKKIFFFVGLSVCFGWVFAMYGLKLSNSINYSFLMKTGIIYTLTFAAIFLKEKFGPRKLLLMFGLLIGAYLISTAGEIIIPKRGDILISLSAFSFSISTILLKKLTKNINPDIIGFGRIAMTLPFLIIFALLIKTPLFSFPAPFLMICASISLVFSTVYQNKTLSIASASYLSMLSMITPILNLILGITLLKEVINPFQLMGAILILVIGIKIQKNNT